MPDQQKPTSGTPAKGKPCGCEGLTRREVLRTGVTAAVGVALTGDLQASQPTTAQAQSSPKRIYIAPDDHTDYMWSADEETYRQVLLEMTDYYLGLTDKTLANPSDSQSRWNCDGSFWMWTYEKNRSRTDFENRFIARLRDGHLSTPLTTLVGVYGGTPTEAVLRGLYYAGRIERRYNLRFPLAVAMENQTLPYGLGTLWAGAGAKYSWRGICNCATQTPNAGDREHEIYWWVGPDGSRILMKWNSLYAQPKFDPKYSAYYTDFINLYGGAHDRNENIGGYGEARYPFELVEFVDSDPTFLAKYPYRVIGAFGEGWDDIKTINSNFVVASQVKATAKRRVIVSNESDFFQDFEATYGANLPSQSCTFGNEWELAIASQQEVSSTVRRAVEKLRAAEALSTLVSLKNRAFLDSRSVSVPLTPGAGSYPPGTTKITDPREARDLAFVNLGLYWEHDYAGGGPNVSTAERIAFNRRTAANIVAYVDGLYNDSVRALGALIQTPVTNPRFYAFNPLGWARTDYADFPYSGSTPVHVIDVSTGKETPSQIVHVNGIPYLRILASNLPAVGYKTFEIRSGVGATFPNAAHVSGKVLENALYRITVADDGAITSLIAKSRGNREFVAQTAQNGRSSTVRCNDLGYNAGANYTSTLSVENAGPVSVTLVVSVSGNDVPLDHVSRITLFASSPRIDIRNDINENITSTTTWGFGFNLTHPDVWYEEVGAVIRAKLLADGGHYSPRNARYDWQSLNHFADISGDGGVGITLSNADCHFMQVGNSTLDTLDTQTAILSPLAGGQVYGDIANQDGDTHFIQRFSLLPHGTTDAPTAMRFALEHQNPPVTGSVTGNSAAPYPASAYSLLTISDPRMLLWALKPAEEGIAQGVIARVWNLSNSASTFNLVLTPTLNAAKQTTHIETNLGSMPVKGNAILPTLKAHQMATYRLILPVRSASDERDPSGDGRPLGF